MMALGGAWGCEGRWGRDEMAELPRNCVADEDGAPPTSAQAAGSGRRRAHSWHAQLRCPAALPEEGAGRVAGCLRRVASRLRDGGDTCYDAIW